MGPAATESTALVEDVSFWARWNLFITFLTPAFAGFLYGYSIGAISGSVDSWAFGRDPPLKTFDISVLTSASIAGATVASTFAFYIGDVIGRRRELIVGSSFYLLGSCMSQLAMHSYDFVYISRFTYGLGIGFSMHSAPAYIAEIAPPELRGAMIAVKELFIVMGLLLGYGIVAIAESIINDEGSQWRLNWAVPPAIAVGILWRLIFYCPPSPRGLLTRGEDDRALEALEYLRPHASRQVLLDNIRDTKATLMEDEVLPPAKGGEADAADGAAEPWRPWSRTELHKWAQIFAARRSLVVGLGIISLQQVTGQPTVLYYAQTIFERAGFEKSSAKHSDVILGAAKFVATLCAIPLVDRMGRRPLLLIGTAAMLVALIVLAIAFGLGSDDDAEFSAFGHDRSAASVAYSTSPPPPSPFGDPLSDAQLGSDRGIDDSKELQGAWKTITILALMTYVSGYQFGFGPVAWVMVGEVFPLHLRARALGLAVTFNFGLNLAVALTNNSLTDAIEYQGVFTIYAVMSALALVFIVVVVPETKGKTLEQIEEMLGQRS